MIRTVIVDDEPLGRRRILKLLKLESDVTVVAECRNGREAVEQIRSMQPDLVFLDIQMPGLDGFDVIERLGPDELPVVIFATAYDEYALRAFDAHALDYLLKPFDRERFASAVERARRQLEDADELHDLRSRMEGLLEDGRIASDVRFQVLTGGTVTIVHARDIDWVEAAGNYAVLHERGKQHVMRETMASMERRLPQAAFLRIHRSAIVRIDRVRSIRPGTGGGYDIELTDGTKLKASRGYRHAVRSRLTSS